MSGANGDGGYNPSGSGDSYCSTGFTASDSCHETGGSAVSGNCNGDGASATEMCVTGGNPWPGCSSGDSGNVI